jgi:hypothetical protein
MSFVKVRLDIADNIYAELVKRAQQDDTTFDEQIVPSIKGALQVLKEKSAPKRKAR